MKYYSIGEASATYNIPESTLRYYEKKGCSLYRTGRGGQTLIFRTTIGADSDHHLPQEHQHAHQRH